MNEQLPLGRIVTDPTAPPGIDPRAWASIRRRLSEMSCRERLDAFGRFIFGYCEECGWSDLTNNCQCWNDE